MMTFTADEAERGLSLWGATVGLVGGGRAAPGFVSVRPVREAYEVGARVDERRPDEGRLTPTAVDVTGAPVSKPAVSASLSPAVATQSLRELAQLKPASGTASEARPSVPDVSWWSKVVAAASKPSPLGGVSWGVVGAVAVGAVVAGVVVARRAR